MSLRALKLRIDAPTGDLLPGRGFYQLEEEALYVQIAPFSRNRRFFSYLESDLVRLDLDKEGRLLFIEVDCARRNWTLSDSLEGSVRASRADVRWLDFRKRMASPQLFTNERRTSLALRFLDSASEKTIRLAENVTIGVTDRNTLAAIRIDHIIDDIAGQYISAFRKKIRKRLKDAVTPVNSS